MLGVSKKERQLARILIDYACSHDDCDAKKIVGDFTPITHDSIVLAPALLAEYFGEDYMSRVYEFGYPMLRVYAKFQLRCTLQITKISQLLFLEMSGGTTRDITCNIRLDSNEMKRLKGIVAGGVYVKYKVTSGLIHKIILLHGLLKYFMSSDSEYIDIVDEFKGIESLYKSRHVSKCFEFNDELRNIIYGNTNNVAKNFYSGTFSIPHILPAMVDRVEQTTNPLTKKEADRCDAFEFKIAKVFVDRIFCKSHKFMKTIFRKRFFTKIDGIYVHVFRAMSKVYDVIFYKNGTPPIDIHFDLKHYLYFTTDISPSKELRRSLLIPVNMIADFYGLDAHPYFEIELADCNYNLFKEWKKYEFIGFHTPQMQLMKSKYIELLKLFDVESFL